MPFEGRGGYHETCSEDIAGDETTLKYKIPTMHTEKEKNYP